MSISVWNLDDHRVKHAQLYILNFMLEIVEKGTF